MEAMLLLKEEMLLRNMEAMLLLLKEVMRRHSLLMMVLTLRNSLLTKEKALIMVKALLKEPSLVTNTQVETTMVPEVKATEKSQENRS